MCSKTKQKTAKKLCQQFPTSRSLHVQWFLLLPFYKLFSFRRDSIRVKFLPYTKKTTDSKYLEKFFYASHTNFLCNTLIKNQEITSNINNSKHLNNTTKNSV